MMVLNHTADLERERRLIAEGRVQPDEELRAILADEPVVTNGEPNAPPNVEPKARRRSVKHRGSCWNMPDLSNFGHHRD